MSRYVNDVQLNLPTEYVQAAVNDFFSREKFTYTVHKGEQVWQKGSGLLTAPQFIKLDYQNGVLHLEAWIKNAILPGVYVGEMGLDGFFGFAIKAALRDKVNRLMALLTQPLRQQAQQPQQQ